MNRIYLDNASTTFADPTVIEAMKASWERQLGNPSSIHRIGVKAAADIEKSRITIATGLGARPEEVIFTSGGTESNALALQGYCLANRERGDHLIVSAIEHPSVTEVANALVDQGFRVTRLPVDAEGIVDPETLRAALTDRTLLVSIMHVNNEIGTVQDLARLAAICNERGIAFHTDATQSFTKVAIDVDSLGIALLTLSAHKVHGPKGIGALYVRKGIRLEPLLKGGGQEGGLRAGTLNTEGIIGFGQAVLCADPTDIAEMKSLRDTLIDRLCSEIQGVTLNGSRRNRVCNNVNVSVEGTSSKRLLFELDRKGIAVSVGSACASGKKTASPVLLALGRTTTEASESLRISLSKWTTRAEIETFIHTFKEIVAKERLNHVESKAG